MSEELHSSAEAILQVLRGAAASDPRLRAALRSLSAALAALGEEPEQTPAAHPVVAAEPAELPGGAERQPAPPRRRTELRLGGVALPIEVPDVPEIILPIAPPRVVADESAAPAPPVHAPPTDLALVARRCRLKAEACRWAIDRRHRLAEGADFQLLAPRDHELLSAAKSQADCYLWMMDPYGPTLPQDKALEEFAGNYDALAAAADLAALLADAAAEEDGAFEQAVRLLAEAQSAVRRCAEAIDRHAPDRDQDDAFRWLRRLTSERQIYLERFMRLDDAAAPAGWFNLQECVAALRERVEQRRRLSREVAQALSKARYHAKKIERVTNGSASNLDWAAVFAAAERLVELGVPPSDKDVRELLLPLADDLPDDVPAGPGVAQALAEIDRFLAATNREPAPSRGRAAGPEVRAVADLLRGKVVVLIGGACRPASKENLERSFELAELRWLSSRPHESVSSFEPAVVRDDTALVLLATRWSSHSFGEIKETCRRHDKPFVQLPGGYNPTQVASQILAQASQALLSRGARAGQ